MIGSKVATVVLAAGGSTRFGEAKQLLEWDGRPLVAHSVDLAWSAGLTPVTVVVGAEAERVIPALEGRPCQILRNYRWAEGLSSSLSVGLAALPASIEAAVFLPVDQPGLTPQFLQALVARWRASGADIVVPTHQGRRGGPVLFARTLFPALAQLSGDVGGRALFAAHADRLVTLPVTDPRLLADVDTLAAYAALRAQTAQRDPAEMLRAIRAVICDMDGVLWRGEEPLPGFLEFFELLQKRNLRYTLVTNNASRTPEQYVEKLARLGVATSVEHVLSSALAAASYLAKNAAPGALVYPVGGAGVPAALRAQGFRLSTGDAADYVVVGWSPKTTWYDMAKATLLIRRGATFIGTNPDRTFPSERGLVPGAGSQLALLEAATDIKPLVVGKPEPILYQQALARMAADPAETLMIGDRLDTDILGGLRQGLHTALLLSGIQRREELAQSPIHPELVFDDLVELVRVLGSGN
ncbi:MAG TPA: HAD-IIA family hydrolase [Thermoflexia bacterium]|nr:HAD-IIA family hydrolase [Thermoflexia bacterium]